MAADLLDAGLDYLRRHGWSVFFVRGKEAAGKWKALQSRRPTERELHRRYERRGLTGVAVVLGAVSGDLWARDFDETDAYPRWATAYPDLARLVPTVQTARGAHVYGVWPGVTFTAFDDGELRAGGGCYCLLPPSKHPTGPPYAWRILPGASIARLDPVTCGLDKTWSVTQRTQGTQVFQDPSGLRSEHVSPDLAGGVPLELLREAIPDGPRQNHDTLFDFARRVRGLEVNRGAPYTMTALCEAIAAWCKLNPHLNPEQTEADYLEEFMEAYDDVRVPFGAEGTLDTTWKTALAATPPPEAAQYGDGLGLLAAWCRELQRAKAGRAFYLATGTVQDRFGLSERMVAWRRLRFLCRLGVLEQVEAGRKRKASTFRYKLPLSDD